MCSEISMPSFSTALPPLNLIPNLTVFGSVWLVVNPSTSDLSPRRCLVRRHGKQVFGDMVSTNFFLPLPQGKGLEIGHLWHESTVDPHPSLRATLSHQERENNEWECGSNRRFLPHCLMKRLLVVVESVL